MKKIEKLGPNTIKRNDIQLNLLKTITGHWERKESNEEFSDILAMFKKNLESHKQFLEKLEEKA
jgi:hypothetical protein